MNNLKKIGLTALGTALVATSASAADYSIAGSSSITFVGGDNKDSGNGWSMGDSVTFSASGEMDNGMTVSTSFELDHENMDGHSISIDTGDLGKLTFAGGSNTSVIGSWDDLTPSANEESWGVAYGGTAGNADGGSAITHNLFIYDYTVMDGVAIKAAYVPSHTTGAVEGSFDYGVHYTGIEGLNLYLAMGENNDTSNGADASNFAISYAMGAMTIGYQANETDYGTGTVDRDFTAVGLSYAVSDDLSVSINQSTIDFESSTLDDQEATAVSFSHTSGGMTVSGTYGSMDNVGGTSTTDNNAYELNLAFAF
jgi:outer membrane protein OmpU